MIPFGLILTLFLLGLTMVLTLPVSLIFPSAITGVGFFAGSIYLKLCLAGSSLLGITGFMISERFKRELQRRHITIKICAAIQFVVSTALIIYLVIRF